MTFDVVGFKLRGIQFGDRVSYATISGKDELGIEAEFRIPLSFRFRSDRRQNPTLEEIAEQAKSNLFGLCVRMAKALNKDQLIEHARKLERGQTRNPRSSNPNPPPPCHGVSFYTLEPSQKEEKAHGYREP